MHEFIARHKDKVAGTLSGFDRLVFRGTLHLINFVEGMWHWAYPGFVDGLVIGSSGGSRLTLLELHG